MQIFWPSVFQHIPLTTDLFLLLIISSYQLPLYSIQTIINPYWSLDVSFWWVSFQTTTLNHNCDVAFSMYTFDNINIIREKLRSKWAASPVFDHCDPPMFGSSTNWRVQLVPLFSHLSLTLVLGLWVVHRLHHRQYTHALCSIRHNVILCCLVWQSKWMIKRLIKILKIIWHMRWK